MDNSKEPRFLSFTVYIHSAVQHYNSIALNKLFIIFTFWIIFNFVRFHVLVFIIM